MEQLPKLTEDTKLCIQNAKDAKHQQEEELAALQKQKKKSKKPWKSLTKLEDRKNRM